MKIHILSSVQSSLQAIFLKQSSSRQTFLCLIMYYLLLLERNSILPFLVSGHLAACRSNQIWQLIFAVLVEIVVATVVVVAAGVVAAAVERAIVFVAAVVADEYILRWDIPFLKTVAGLFRPEWMARFFGSIPCSRPYGRLAHWRSELELWSETMTDFARRNVPCPFPCLATPSWFYLRRSPSWKSFWRRCCSCYLSCWSDFRSNFRFRRPTSFRFLWYVGFHDSDNFWRWRRMLRRSDFRCNQGTAAPATGPHSVNKNKK